MAFGDTATMVANVVDNKKIEISVSETGMTGLTVYRVASGANITVRGAENATPTGPGLWVGAEHEAPQGKTLQYAADITDGVTQVTVGPVTVNGTVDYGGDWLMPVGQPNLGMNVTVEAGGMGDLTRDIVQDIQPVLNRNSPVVVSFNRRYFEGTFTFLTLEEADREQLKLILGFPVVMFVSRLGYGFSDPVFLALGKAVEKRTSPFGYEPSRRWDIDVVKVDRPPADYPYVTVGVSWLTRENVPNTWQTASDNYIDWYSYAGYPA